MRNILAHLTPSQLCLNIYDQLKPAHAKYYSAQEARALFETNGFRNVRLYHRHGYSWTVIGEK